MFFGVFLVAYLVLAVLVGLCGRHRRMGFIGFFILSLLITPVLGLLVAYITAEQPRVEAAAPPPRLRSEQ